ncbi:MAG: DUF1415 domain-containing protein [Gammaproteobacteria bacterium]|nr:DUF1415 domain-containing protein [Gammaproteobacteria bacterium]
MSTDLIKNHSIVIEHTRCWIKKVIIGLNFCPFARREFDRDNIHYAVINQDSLDDCLQVLVDEAILLDSDDTIETSLLIFTQSLTDFDSFLDYIELANALLLEQGYEGVYQLASFHPDYCFAGEAADDAANFTNRSPYPMLHLIRETSIERALQHYPDPEAIPDRNIELARSKGLATMRQLLDSCK